MSSLSSVTRVPSTENRLLKDAQLDKDAKPTKD